MKKILAIFVLAFLSFNLVSAVTVNSVFADDFTPGSEGTIRIEVENNLDETVENVALILKFTNTQFIPVGTSEQSLDELDEGDDEEFFFTVKSSTNIVPGDYEIPYTLQFFLDDEIQTRTGSIGLSVSGNPELSFSATAETPVVGRQGTITLQLVNKGFSDARFVSVRALPEGFTLLSDKEVYIGQIDSDDFETAVFDVKFNEEDVDFKAIVEYVNFENQKIISEVEIPLEIYSHERAVELGIIQQAQTGIYVAVLVFLILIIILWRYLRKKKRLKRSQKMNGER